MKTEEFVKQAEDEVKDLTRTMNDIIDEYIVNSSMPKNQRLVNVGRALNAFHVAWVGYSMGAVAGTL